MGTCEDSCPSISVVNEISNLEVDSTGAHDGVDADRHGSSEQAPVQKLDGDDGSSGRAPVHKLDGDDGDLEGSSGQAPVQKLDGDDGSSEQAPVHKLDGDDGDRDPDGSSEQALVEKLENSHLEEKEEKAEGKGDEAAGADEGEKENDVAGEEREEAKEKEKKEEDDEKEEREQNENGHHPYPLRPEAEDCLFYMKTGSCKFGFNCRFNHPLNRANQLVNVDGKDYDVQGTDDTKKIDCKYYLAPEGCKYGDACRYSHSKAKTDIEMPELNFLGLPIRMGEKECQYYMRNGSCGYGANCRFHHPDPTAANEDPKKPVANGGALQGSKSFAVRNIAEFAPPMSQMSQSVSTSSSENLPSYMPWMNSLPQGMTQVTGYNQYQVSVSLADNTLNSRSSRFVTGPLKKADSFGHNHQLVKNEQFPERPGEPECDYFMKTGTCKFQSACRYHHPKSRLQNMPNGASHNLMKEANHVTHHPQMVQTEEYPERPGQTECTYFMKTGQCKYKSACKYHHPKNRVSKPATSMYSMNSLPSGLVPILPHEAKMLPDSYPSHLKPMATPFKQHLQPARTEEFPERPGQPECEYFLKTGDCKYKSACRYHHPKGSRSQASTGSDCALNEMGLPLRPGATICRNYEQLGICKYGPRCLFDHPSNYDPSSVTQTPPESPPGSDPGSRDWEDGWVIG